MLLRLLAAAVDVEVNVRGNFHVRPGAGSAVVFGAAGGAASAEFTRVAEDKGGPDNDKDNYHDPNNEARPEAAASIPATAWLTWFS